MDYRTTACSIIGARRPAGLSQFDPSILRASAEIAESLRASRGRVRPVRRDRSQPAGSVVLDLPDLVAAHFFTVDFSLD
jgi:hypothetical protein